VNKNNENFSPSRFKTTQPWGVFEERRFNEKKEQ